MILCNIHDFKSLNEHTYCSEGKRKKQKGKGKGSKKGEPLCTCTITYSPIPEIVNTLCNILAVKSFKLPPEHEKLQYSHRHLLICKYFSFLKISLFCIFCFSFSSSKFSHMKPLTFRVSHLVIVRMFLSISNYTNSSHNFLLFCIVICSYLIIIMSSKCTR